MNKLLQMLASSEAFCFVLILLGVMIANEAIGQDKKCVYPYEKDYSYNQCVKTTRESCTHSCYRHKCGYGFHYGKYKYGCGYKHDYNCPGNRTVKTSSDGIVLHRGICQ